MKFIEVPFAETMGRAIGVNHYTWIAEFLYNGKGALPLVRAKLVKKEEELIPADLFLIKMILLNFSAPFKSLQLAQAEIILHESIDRVVNFTCQVDSDMEILPQFLKLMAKLPLSDAELKNEPIVVVLPQQNYLAVLVMAYLHGRMGYFPPVIRTRLKMLGILPLHEAVELLDPQAVEDTAK